MREGTWNIDRRIDDMNANGMLGSMCFPSFPQFCGQLFARTEDKDQALAMLQAYNDWHVDEWCGSYPGRHIPLGLPAVWDPEIMAAEVRRLAAKGCQAVTFSENPEKLGWPSFHNEHWDPFWKACVDTGTVVCLHIGSSSELVITSVEAPINVMISLQPMNIVQCAADLVWSRVMTEFPDLRFALSEGGIGWIPYFLERIDYVYDHHHRWTGQDLGGKYPSEFLNERFFLCFIDDTFGLESRDHINMDNVCWECDYPHSDSTWPTSPEQLSESLGGLDETEIEGVTFENACRAFNYDPFVHIPKEEATVAALRSKATGVDVSETTVHENLELPTEPIRIIDLVEKVK